DPYEPEEDPDAGVFVPTTLCQGRNIRKITVEGARRVEDDDVLATMSLRVGVPCTDPEITADAESLWDLGFFDNIRVEGEAVGDDAIDLTIRVEERPAIAAIEYDGNDEVNDDDMNEVITLREGAILSIPDVRRQITKIRDKYAEEGYFLDRKSVV